MARATRAATIDGLALAARASASVNDSDAGMPAGVWAPADWMQTATPASASHAATPRGLVLFATEDAADVLEHALRRVVLGRQRHDRDVPELGILGHLVTQRRLVLQ